MSYFMHLLAHVVSEMSGINDESSKEEEQQKKKLYNKYFNKRPYDNIPTKKIKEWALSNNPQACLELSLRYRNGTMLLEENEEQCSFWARRAIELFSEQSNNAISSYFKKHLSYWFNENNDHDCSTYLNFQRRRGFDSPETLEQYFNNFNIGLEEEILFARDTSYWDSRTCGLVITEKAIYVKEIDDKFFRTTVLEWSSIYNVSYSNNLFFFYGDDGKAIYSTKINSFFKKISPERMISEKLGEELSTHLTKMALLYK